MPIMRVCDHFCPEPSCYALFEACYREHTEASAFSRGKLSAIFFKVLIIFGFSALFLVFSIYFV